MPLRRAALGRALLVTALVAAGGCRVAVQGLSTDVDLVETGVDASSGDAADDVATPPDDVVTSDAPLFPVEDTTPPECEGKPDGTTCGMGAERTICLKEACTPSKCGDGFVDTGGGEDCDDGNLEDGDSCPSDCKYKCTTNAECDDGLPCTVNTCDLTKHVCAPPTAATKGLPCSPPTGGFCNGTSCTVATCGNGKVEPPEQCDDGNTNDADGCKSDCTWTCTTNADCDDKNACNGVETCDTGTHKCKPGTVISCNDGNACTLDTCNMATATCTNALIDLDGDGFASSKLGACGKDCNDLNPTVNPGQTGWFSSPYTTITLSSSFDYNCDGKQEQRFTTTGSCVKSGSTCVYTIGWIAGPPACGNGDYIVDSCSSACKPVVSTTKYVQQCR